MSEAAKQAAKRLEGLRTVEKAEKGTDGQWHVSWTEPQGFEAVNSVEAIEQAVGSLVEALDSGTLTNTEEDGIALSLAHLLWLSKVIDAAS